MSDGPKAVRASYLVVSKRQLASVQAPKAVRIEKAAGGGGGRRPRSWIDKMSFARECQNLLLELDLLIMVLVHTLCKLEYEARKLDPNPTRGGQKFCEKEIRPDARASSLGNAIAQAAKSTAALPKLHSGRSAWNVFRDAGLAPWLSGAML